MTIPPETPRIKCGVPYSEITLSSPETSVEGYTRRFDIGIHEGLLLFGFVGSGSRDDRSFRISANFDENPGQPLITCTESDSARELVGIMNDDAAAKRLVRQAEESYFQQGGSLG